MEKTNSKTPEKPVVYFTDFRTVAFQVGLLDKLQTLLKKAEIAKKIDFAKKFAAIKIHFGEYGNLAYLRPNYVKVVADYVKENGGIPFLTDCNTLYAGSRKNAIEHLETAELNGFNSVTTGCYNIIADGLKGNNEVELPVPNGVYVKKAKIGRAIADADVIIALTHFKGHEGMGIGGSIKNIGMGCGSRAGKMEMHSDGKPAVQDNCVGCCFCLRACAHAALTLVNGKMTIDYSKCVGCGRCLALCPNDAIQCANWQSNEMLCYKTAEYASAVVNGKPALYINILSDISPNCDCHCDNDAPVVPNIGMLCSLDPVAIDVASVDLCNQAPRLPQSMTEDAPVTADLFTDIHTDTNWRNAIDHAVKIGLGSADYVLKKI